MHDRHDHATVPSHWLRSLERGMEQIEVGETRPMAPVLQRLRAGVERLESKRAKAVVPKA